MTREELNEIELKIKAKIRKIAGNTGYGYLNCNRGQWKDGRDDIHIISKMDTTYLERCLNTAKNANHFIDIDFHDVNEIIEVDQNNLTQNDKDEILKITKRYLYNLHDEKIEEIESELSSRKER